MRRRAIARTAVVGGAAYAAGKHASGQQQQYEEPPAPVQEPAVDPLEQLKQLNELREQGILTEEEFTAEKHKLLGQ
jgi:hypothetical protein